MPNRKPSPAVIEPTAAAFTDVVNCDQRSKRTANRREWPVINSPGAIRSFGNS